MPQSAAPADAAKRAPKTARWVEPRLVAEVRFTEWTPDRSLRHPAFLGLREDKSPREVVLDPRTGTAEAEALDLPHQSARPKQQHSKIVRPRSVTPKGSADVAGVRITHANKVLWPDTGYTKLDLARYYEAVAERILPHFTGRPLSLVRAPDGIGKQTFFQKHEHVGTPKAIRRVQIPEGDGTGAEAATYLTVDDVAGLVSLAQIGVVEIHPWGSTVRRLEQPDRIIFDLDPDGGLPWSRVCDAAFELREALAGAAGLQSFAKTTGGKGLHVVVPLDAAADWGTVKFFAKTVAEACAGAAPDRYTANLAKRARTGRIFIDYLRNGRGATAVAAYSPRARSGATVSMPVGWDDVAARIDPREFTVATVPVLLAKRRKDPWEGFASAKQTLPGVRAKRSSAKKRLGAGRKEAAGP